MVLLVTRPPGQLLRGLIAWSCHVTYQSHVAIPTDSFTEEVFFISLLTSREGLQSVCLQCCLFKIMFTC